MLLVVSFLFGAGCFLVDDGGGNEGEKTPEADISSDSGIDETTDGNDTGDGVTTSDGTKVIFNIKDASALALLKPPSQQETTSNLKKVVGDKLEDVISAEGTDATGSALSVEEALPRVDQMFLGPNGVVVLFLKENLFVEAGEGCLFVRITSSGETVECIDPLVTSLPVLWTPQRSIEIPGGYRNVQFDSLGSIYYVRDSSLWRWSVSDQTLKQLTNDAITVGFYAISPSGDVWIKGRTKIGGTDFFRRLKIDGSLEDAFIGSVINFRLVDSETLLVSGDEESQVNDFGLFRLQINSNSSLELTPIIRNNNALFQRPGDWALPHTSGYNIYDFQKSSTGRFFALDGTSGKRYLLEIHPASPRFVVTAAAEITFFRIVDQDLYLVGRNSANRHIFHKIDPDDSSSEEDLLGGQNIQIYHFIVAGRQIYFDGLRFSDNKLILGRIDQNNGNQLEELSEIQASLIDLEFVQ
jgi:hypothetical protein